MSILFYNNFNRVAIIDYRAQQLVPQRHCLYMVLLQPLVVKNISLLIFEEFLFSNNFKSVATIDSIASKLVPQRLVLIMVLLKPLVWKNMGHAYMFSFGALELIMGTLLKLLQNEQSFKIRDIFFKTKDCSKTIQRPLLYEQVVGLQSQ